MRLKDILNITNIKNFIEGNTSYYYDVVIGLPEHLKQQINYRLFKCKNDCVVTGVCSGCGMGCPTNKKVYASKSCNNNKRFPDLMPKKEWEEFKRKNKIDERDLRS